MPASDDYVTQAIQALANVLNTHVDGLGYVFDTDDNNPSPDIISPTVVGQYANAGPVVTFSGPEAFDFTRPGSTMGASGRVFDGTVVIVKLTHGFWNNYTTTYGSRARVFVYRIRKAILEHNKLGLTVDFISQVKPGAGRSDWLPDPEGNKRYVTEIPVDIQFEFQITPGN